MASISRDPVSKKYHIHFRFGGKQYEKSLKTTNQKEASTKMGSIENLLLAMEQGHREVPAQEDLWPYLFSGGQLKKKISSQKTFTLEQLFTDYLENLPVGRLEPNTLLTHRIHKKHLFACEAKNRRSDHHAVEAPAVHQWSGQGRQNPGDHQEGDCDLSRGVELGEGPQPFSRRGTYSRPEV